jgi:hypothetical protein
MGFLITSPAVALVSYILYKKRYEQLNSPQLVHNSYMACTKVLWLQVAPSIPQPQPLAPVA